MVASTRQPGQPVHLTQRQIEVVCLAATGKSAYGIARLLQISPRTVDDHLAAARLRVGAMSTGELIGRCWAAGILEAGRWPPRWSGKTCVQFVELAPK
jgi:DNA-binding CsgD family transcriptional regulator